MLRGRSARADGCSRATWGLELFEAIVMVMEAVYGCTLRSLWLVSGHLMSGVVAG